MVFLPLRHLTKFLRISLSEMVFHNAVHLFCRQPGSFEIFDRPIHHGIEDFLGHDSF